jgi:hypothetical protein
VDKPRSVPDTLDNEQCVSPIELMRLPKSCRSTRTGAGVGPGVGTGIGSATAADNKDEATRATARRRANILSKRLRRGWRGGEDERETCRFYMWGDDDARRRVGSGSVRV